MNWDDVIVEAALTDTGMRRSNNQDSYAIVRASKEDVWRRRGHLFMVADGMGAHAVGELASKLACDNIPHNYIKSKTDTAASAIVRAYREVGGIINSKATANSDFQGMGTTCSTLLLLSEGALIAHVGDSRVYRIREDKIEQLTFDHSLVWELVRHKHLTLEQASRSVPRNVITRSLGPDPVVEVDIEGPYPVATGEVYLLCSDGLSGPVTDPELGAIAANFPPEDACRYVTQLANLRGGMDNITTVIVRIGPWVEPGGDPAAAAGGAGASGAGGRGSWITRVIPGFSRKAAKVDPVVERVYQTAECPLDKHLLKRIAEDVRNAQAMAVDQAWTLDWSVLANLRREAEDAKKEKDLRGCMRCLCESVSMLGQAGRVHRKEQATNGNH